MTAAELRALAPRLSRAWEQAQERAAQARPLRRVLIDEIQRTEWLLAHRELQELRACATLHAKGGQGRYIRERHRKLEASQRAIERKRQKLAALDQTIKEAAA